jgi:hypothetical protein
MYFTGHVYYLHALCYYYISTIVLRKQAKLEMHVAIIQNLYVNVHIQNVLKVALPKYLVVII